MKGYGALARENIRYLLKDRPHLTPVFTSTLCIPERLKEYDDELFIAFNNKTERFEIHCVNSGLNRGQTTFNAALPYKKLDARTLRYVWKNDIRVHGRQIHRDLEKSENDHQIRKQKEYREHVRDLARETQSMFAHDAWL